MQARSQAADIQRREEMAQRHASARKRAACIWSSAKPAPADHPYLVNKGVPAHGLRMYLGALVVPVRDTAGELHGLQFIGVSAIKRFLKDTAVQGHCFPIGGPGGPNVKLDTVLGESIFPFLVAALLGWTDWRWIWAGAGGVALLVALPVLRLMAAPLPQDLPNDPSTTTGGALGDSMRRRDLLRRPAFLAALPVVLMFPFMVTAIFLHQGSISALRGWSASDIAIGYLCFAGTQALSTWLAGLWVDRHGAISLFRFYLLPLAAGVLLGAFAPPEIAIWGLYLGLGLASGGQTVSSGALWAELFGLRRLGLVRGVYTALMVLSTAASAPLLGMALQAQISLTSMATGVAIYTIVVPLILARALRPVLPTTAPTA